jgi:hypothetical protein
MIFLLILSSVIGIITGIISGISSLGWVVAGVVFVCGLPGLLIHYLIHGFISYSHDRADYRQYMTDLSADMRALDKERADDVRADRLIDKFGNKSTQVFNDNRQVHLYRGG